MNISVCTPGQNTKSRRCGYPRLNVLEETNRPTGKCVRAPENKPINAYSEHPRTSKRRDIYSFHVQGLIRTHRARTDWMKIPYYVLYRRQLPKMQERCQRSKKCRSPRCALYSRHQRCVRAVQSYRTPCGDVGFDHAQNKPRGLAFVQRFKQRAVATVQGLLERRRRVVDPPLARCKDAV